jgi:uncharacterized protein (TIGR00297 family)
MVGTVTEVQYREPSSRSRYLRLLLAFALSAAIALLGWLARTLDRSGLVAAIAVGTAILSRTGLAGVAALGAFFVGASLISRLAPDRTIAFESKGQRRDAMQVFANGGAAALGALIPGAGFWIVTASLAAAAADTWATSMGGWSRPVPRLIVTLQPVAPGTSGGITLIGTAGAAAGAAVVGCAAAFVSGDMAVLPLALGIGPLGMLFDSLLGAVAQGRFQCDACGESTERVVHRCGRPSRLTGGFRWLTNDGVNGLATALAALAGCAAWWYWRA